LEQPDPLDERSPIDRFRSPPKKTLSVTDIISPAWCELQYWYSLTKYGKVRRTAAMKQGSSVHKVLEEQAATVLPVEHLSSLVERILQEELKAIVPAATVQQVVQKALEQEKRTAVPLDVIGSLVHQVVEKVKFAPVAVDTVSASVHKVTGAQVQKAVTVDVESKEDAFGLRIWNIIQNLRILRATGKAREFETWAVIEGQVVNGVIDELSYECPDGDSQADAAQQIDTKAPKRGRPKKQKVIPDGQTNLNTFFGGTQPPENGNGAWLGVPHANRKIYITDVKTRGSKSMPKGEAAFRPTSMQLMMYHRMLSQLSSNSVPAEQVFTRYGLDSSVPFSDMFIAQLGSLEGASAGDPDSSSQEEKDAVDELIAHNSLDKLWSLMVTEFQHTMPSPQRSSTPSPIGDVLRAEYRASGSGSVIGSKIFTYDATILDAYLKKTMAWWNGERMPRGVEIEEAFKCRFCEFAEVCTWRKDKIEEGVQKARLRNQSKTKSDV
jgi:exonuclease V